MHPVSWRWQNAFTRRVASWCWPAIWQFSSRTTSSIRSAFWVSRFLPLHPPAESCISYAPSINRTWSLTERQTIEGAQRARTRGAYCVGISDTYVSPLARECDEVFLASIESTTFGASYTAPIALLNAILAAVGQYRRAQTLALAKEIAEEQRKGFRWYNA